jgi:argininosuccinate lyase
MENPATKAWSGRFEGSLHETIYKFNASIPFDIELIEYDIQGSKAHAQMLGETGIIVLEEQQKLLLALDEILVVEPSNRILKQRMSTMPWRSV